jgi:hypothetical protein
MVGRRRFRINNPDLKRHRKVRGLFVAIVITFALLLSLPVVSLAQEEWPKLSLGSAQGLEDLQVIPGHETKGVVYYYNTDGNCTAYITLEVAVDPDQPEMTVVESVPGKLYEVSWGDTTWEVEIDPPLHDIQVSLNPEAPPVTVPVNLYAEVTEVSAQEIEDVPEGMICLTLPNKLGADIPGYTLAKPVIITVRVPKAEDYEITHTIKILATGSYLGQGGIAILGQQREFPFNITTVPKITQEQIITDGGGFDIGKWLPWIIVGVVVIGAGMVIISLSVKRKGV